jgi:hypothetical protein
VARQRRQAVKSFDELPLDANPGKLDNRLQSYAIALQGDLEAVSTILALTRNIRGGNNGDRKPYVQKWGGRDDNNRWKFPQVDRKWDGVDYRAHLRWGGNVNRRVDQTGFRHENQFLGPGSLQNSMTGLDADQGNWLTGGGSVAQGSSSEFNDALRASDKNFQQGVAITLRPNLIIMRPYQ